MKKYYKVSIVIPIFKNELNDFEKISLHQALNIFGNYDIFFVVPEKFSGYVPKGVKVEKFNSKYFKSVKTYNKLMLDISFYEHFSAYEYILIYQLDAFVFEDKLRYFCDLQYDYIGAPWLSGAFHYIDKKHCIWYVGNGGLSLRKIHSFINTLKKKQDIVENYTLNEDVFYSSIISKEFRIAPLEIALQFSFEQQVLECFQKNNQQLPFGCHAWMRYDFEFWRPYIEKFGFDIKNSFCCIGNDDEKLEYIYRKNEKRNFFWRDVYCNINIEKFLENLFGRKIEMYIVFGAGYYGVEICNILADANINVKCVVDNNKELWGKYLGKYEIKSIECIELEKIQGIIVAVKNYTNEITKQLHKMGYIYREDYVCLEDFFI